ncbi:MAG: hypothetical protein JRH20_15915 [Deltaproteobacteria bacterium]|nr:hypothetical protein [Deltaproteobacteria bacterium]
MQLRGRVVGPGGTSRPVLITDGKAAWPLPPFFVCTDDGRSLDVDAQGCLLQDGQRGLFRGKAHKTLNVGDDVTLEGRWVSVARGESGYRSAAMAEQFEILRVIRRLPPRRWMHTLTLAALGLIALCSLALALEVDRPGCIYLTYKTRSQPVATWCRATEPRGVFMPAGLVHTLNCIGEGMLSDPRNWTEWEGRAAEAPFAWRCPRTVR